MAIVVYECNTCKRSIEIERNIHGLEVFNRCVITKGCRGDLYQTNVLLDYVRGKNPDTVVGLTNWEPRKILFDFFQTVTSNIWKINHNLNSIPTIQVYVNSPTESNPRNLVLREPDNIKVIDQNTVHLIFDRQWAGMAQLLTHTSNFTSIAVNNINEELPVQITTNQELSFGLRGSNNSNVTIQIEIINTDGSTLVTTYSVDTIPSILSPWHEAKRISINGITYTVRSFNVNVSDLLNFTRTGAVIRIVGIDVAGGSSFVPFEPKQGVILLSKPPYKIFDAIYNQYVYVSDTLNNSAMFYDNNEFKVIPSVIKMTFPPIHTFTN